MAKPGLQISLTRSALLTCANAPATPTFSGADALPRRVGFRGLSFTSRSGTPVRRDHAGGVLLFSIRVSGRPSE